MHSSTFVQVRDAPILTEVDVADIPDDGKVVEYAPRTELVFSRLHKQGPSVVKVMRKGPGALYNREEQRGARVHRKQTLTRYDD